MQNYKKQVLFSDGEAEEEAIIIFIRLNINYFAPGKGGGNCGIDFGTLIISGVFCWGCEY